MVLQNEASLVVLSRYMLSSILINVVARSLFLMFQSHVVCDYIMYLRPFLDGGHFKIFVDFCTSHKPWSTSNDFKGLTGKVRVFPY